MCMLCFVVCDGDRLISLYIVVGCKVFRCYWFFELVDVIIGCCFIKVDCFDWVIFVVCINY